MGMVVQHNTSAMIANNAMNKNVAGLKKQTEKLSTGYNINRAADNAAGLAISEKMRSQIRGLSQATANSNDAISLIQTAEGGLQETEDILQRMRELSVQSANGTYTDEDREQIQFEVDALKSEIDRISQSTEYNEMKLLDGSLDGVTGSNTDYGAKYGSIGKAVTSTEATDIAADTNAANLIASAKAVTDDDYAKALGFDDAAALNTASNDDIAAALATKSDAFLQKLQDSNITGTTAAAADITNFNTAVADNSKNVSAFDGAVLTASVQGASIEVTTGATKGGEGASWGQDGKTLTLNLVDGKTYTQDDIDKLIKNADTKKADGVVADISLKLKDGVYTASNGDKSAKSVAGERAESQTISLLNSPSSVQAAFNSALAAEQRATAAAATAKNAFIDTAITHAADDISGSATDTAINAALGLTGSPNAITTAELSDGSWKTKASAAAAAMNNTALSTAAATIANQTGAGSTEATDFTTAVTAETAATAARTAAQTAYNTYQSNAASNAAGVLTSPTEGYGDQIKFTSNSYGVDTRKFSIATDAQAGKESVESTTDDTPGNKDGEYTIHLSTGVEYSKSDIEKLMAKAGLDYSVEISDSNKPDGDVKMKLDIAVNEATAQTRANSMANGEGVGKEEVAKNGDGLTFQIGANGVEDQRLTVNIGDMGANALNVNNISVATQDGANDAINKLDDAIKTVSTQRAKLGAVQNRLEHTVNSLNTANENMTASESQIRDTDMASEMIKYTKSNILQQASQSMLAQANQQPQGVLQLLG